MSVRITWGRVNELQCKIAQRFSVSYDLKNEKGPGYSEYWSLTVNDNTLPKKFLSPREVFTYLTGVEAGLELTVPAVCDEVLKHMDEAEDYDFEDSLLRTEQMTEYFQEHAGTLPMPVFQLALDAMTSIIRVVNQDLEHRVKGNYSHNIISLSLSGMCNSLIEKHQFTKEDARQITNLILEAAPIVTTLYGIHPEGN